MDFAPPPLLCLLSEVFSLRLFFPATVTDSVFGHRCIWTHNKEPLTSRLSWFRCTRVLGFTANRLI